MASIYKRKDKMGKVTGWRAVIRIEGYPTVCKQFDRKQEADDWAANVERQIKLGQFAFHQHKQVRTFAELIERYIQDGVLQHRRSADDTLHHLNYWKQRLGSYGLVHITADLLSKERQQLQETPTRKGLPRTAATTNRYMASLSALLSYAAHHLRWLSENPALRLKKLKEGPGRDRVLSKEEIMRLLQACRESKSPYLYAYVLFSLTTGARQGEILNLEWRHIDWQQKLALIKQTKNGRPRSIALCDSIIEELQQLYSKRNPLKPLVFASKTAFGRIDLKKAWQQALMRANITNCRAHDMRHTFCSFAASMGASNLQLATATGHRTLAMLVHYTHMDAQVTKPFSDKISQHILKGE